MVNKLTIYIAKTLLGTILLALTLLVGLEFLFSLVNEIRHVGTGDYTTTKVISYILLSLPSQIYDMFPMSALLGTILGLGLLATRSELIVMRAAGLSMGDIIIAVAKLAIFLIVGTCLLGEWVAPTLDKFATEQKAVALSGGQALRTEHGTWMRDGNNFIHIQSMDAGKHLEGITRYEFNQNMELQKASVARNAEYLDDHWVLHDIKETLFEKGKISRNRISIQTWVSDIDPDVLSLVGTKDIEDLSLIGLWQTIQYREANALDVKPYQLAFWQKLGRPFATLVMMFLAIPFIFGPLRSATMGLRMLVGILVGFAFYTFNELFGPLTLVYPIPPILGALLPSCFFFGLGLILMRKNQ